MTVEWLEVSVTTDNETAEAVAEVLSRYAYRGVTIEAGPEGWNAGPVVVRAYLPADEQLRANKRRVEQALGHLNQISPVAPPLFRSVAEEDWTEAWKQRLSVLHTYAPELDSLRDRLAEFASSPGRGLEQSGRGLEQLFTVAATTIIGAHVGPRGLGVAAVTAR